MVQTDVAPKSNPPIMHPPADCGYAHYGVAKAGIADYTRYLAQDLGRSASLKRINTRRSRSSSISMPPTRCTGIRKGASFTAATIATFTCR